MGAAVTRARADEIFARLTGIEKQMQEIASEVHNYSVLTDSTRAWKVGYASGSVESAHDQITRARIRFDIYARQDLPETETEKVTP